MLNLREEVVNQLIQNSSGKVIDYKGKKIETGRVYENNLFVDVNEKVKKIRISEKKSYNKSDTFSDYPKSARNNAQQALDWKEEHGDEVKGGTRVGWTRANDIANGRPMSYDTVKRIKAFFDRHKENFDVAEKHKSTPWKDNGRVSELLWGGQSMYNWAKGIVNKVEGSDD